MTLLAQHPIIPGKAQEAECGEEVSGAGRGRGGVIVQTARDGAANDVSLIDKPGVAHQSCQLSLNGKPKSRLLCNWNIDMRMDDDVSLKSCRSNYFNVQYVQMRNAAHRFYKVIGWSHIRLHGVSPTDITTVRLYLSFPAVRPARPSLTRTS